MEPRDIRQVMEIERNSFPTPWPARAYRHELRFNRSARYFVAIPRVPTQSSHSSESIDTRLIAKLRNWFEAPVPERLILGYGGCWLMDEEAHISTLAVRPDYRGRGIGELLLVTIIDEALDRGAKLISLEVRASNTAAQNLYQKYSFVQTGRKQGYYSDNDEDALIMHRKRARSPKRMLEFNQLKEDLQKKLREQTSLQSDEEPTGQQRHSAT